MPEQFKHTTLPNGLTIIAECDPNSHTAAAGFFVRTGARDETADVMGVSHFLEHMMFKGTAKRSAEDINREFDEIGARANAYTSSEMTAFHASSLPEHLPRVIDVLSDMMRPALREADFTTEKGVILEEIAMYKDDPGWVLYEKSLEEHYAAHPLAYRVLGTEKTITDLAASQMRDYFARRYSADNTVVALAGKLDFDAAVAQISAACASWARTGADRNHTHPTFGTRSFELRDAKVTRAYRLMLAEGPGATDPRRYAAFVLTQLLGGPDNSRLHWSLIETGLAEEAEASYEPKDSVGDLRVLVACDPSNLDEAWQTVEHEIKGLADAITDADVQRIRAKVATGVTLAGERPEGRMHRLGRQWLYERAYTTLQDELDRISAVTIDDVRALIHEFAMDGSSPRTIGTLRPA